MRLELRVLSALAENMTQDCEALEADLGGTGEQLGARETQALEHYRNVIEYYTATFRAHLERRKFRLTEAAQAAQPPQQAAPQPPPQ